MEGPSGLDIADQLGSVVGATAGVISVLLVLRSRGTAAGSRPATTRWLRICVPLGLLAAAVGVARLLGARTPGPAWLPTLAALVLGLASAALYLADRRRPLIGEDERLHALLTAELEDSTGHRYEYFGVNAPLLPKIYVEQRADRAGEHSAVLTVPQMLARFDDVLVVAEPGMGKSMMIRLIQHRQADWLLGARRGSRMSRAPFGPIVPVVVPATALADRNLPDALAEYCGRRASVKVDPALFRTAPLPGVRWLVLVDGLDEVLSGTDRSDVINRLAGWLDRGDPARRFVVATRPLLFGELSDVRGSSVAEFALRRFDPDDLVAFARKWFEARGAPAAADPFLKAVAEARLGPAVEVPLLATIAALVFEQRQDRPLPVDRTGLYRQFVRHLLDGRPEVVDQRARMRGAFARYGEAGTSAGTWLDDHLVELVEHLADIHLTLGVTGLAEEAHRWVREQAPAETRDAVPDQDRHVRMLLGSTSVLVERHGELAFTHHSLAEYLAAGHRARHFDEARWFSDVRAPERRNLALFVLGRRTYEPADPLVAALLSGLDTDVPIAGEILADGVEVSPFLRSQVIMALFTHLLREDPTAPEALRVLTALAVDPVIAESLSDLVTDANTRPWVRVLVAEALDEIGVTSGGLERLAAEPSLPRSIAEWLGRRSSGGRAGPIEDGDGPAPSHLQTYAYRRALSEGSSEPRYLLIIALQLADAGEESGLTALRGCCVEPELRLDLRLRAARALLRVDPAGQTQWLRSLAHDQRQALDVRAAAATALAEVDDEGSALVIRELHTLDETLDSRLPPIIEPAPAAVTIPALAVRTGTDVEARAGAGQIITFFSYKGGTGRTMALANVAWLLAAGGSRVLMVDWDLESPGLHRFFHPFIEDPMLETSTGVIDIVREFSSALLEPSFAESAFLDFADVRSHAVRLNYSFPEDGRIDLLPAGRQSRSYSRAVTTLDWGAFLDRGGTAFLEEMRDQMRRNYDYVLIDSATGVSRTAAICTVLFPDVLVNGFTLQVQSIEGALSVTRSIRAQRERRPVRILPVPMRVDSAEMQSTFLGRQMARERFDPMLSADDVEDRDEYWAETEIPYRAYYAYEEILAIFAERTGQANSLLSAYERLTRHIVGRPIEYAAPDAAERQRWLAMFERPRRSPNGTLLISCALPDRVWAEWIGAQFRYNGWHVEIRAVHETADALAQADRIIVVLSAAYTEDSGSEAVIGAAAGREPTEEGRFLIPVRVHPERSITPTAMARIPVVDVSGVGADQARDVLFRAVTPFGPKSPDVVTPPNYPGTGAEFVGGLRPAHPHTLGREPELWDLRERLLAGDRRVVVAGPPGIGKTNLAAQYANRFASAYSLVWWIDAAGRERADDLLDLLAAHLKTPETEARNTLRYRSNWLVVVDGLGGGLPPWLANIDGALLVTARGAAGFEAGDVLTLGPLSREHAAAVLAGPDQSMPRADAAAIAGRLGDHPLLVGVAGAAQRAGYVSTGDLLHSATDAGTLLGASLAGLRSADPAAARLLELACCLGPGEIPFPALRELGPFPAQAVRELGRAGLAVVDAGREKLVVHDLIRDAVLAEVDAERMAANRRLVHRALLTTAASDDGLHLVLAHLEPSGCLDSTEPEIRDLVTGVIRRLWVSGWRATAQALADRARPPVGLIDGPAGSGRAAGMLRTGELLRGRMIAEETDSTADVAALAFLLLGDFEAAAAADWAIYGRCLRSAGPRDPRTLLAAERYARDLRALGDLAGARTLLAEILPVVRDVLGTDDPQTLRTELSWNINSRLLGATGSESLVERFRAVFGADHPDTAAAEIETALATTDTAMARHALEIVNAAYGDGHPTSLAFANNLAVVLFAAGDEVAARELFAATEEKLDEEHVYRRTVGMNRTGANPAAIEPVIL
ncbi:TIR domain-containing protein [Actinoplanes sp. NPDC051861]|uniref:KGGVGR-motif variant AAA ATPase n=1 Tax=Actinoplanes sp. NPDC051861 TaxID=3155170 RepID=UPI00342CB9A4